MFKRKKAEETTTHKCCDHVGHDGRSCEVYHWWLDQQGKTVKITTGALAETIGRLSGGFGYTCAKVTYKTGCHLHYTARSIWITYTDLRVVDETEPECHNGRCVGDNVDCDDAGVCEEPERVSCCSFCKPQCQGCCSDCWGGGCKPCLYGGPLRTSHAAVYAGTPESLWAHGGRRQVSLTEVEVARQIIHLRPDGTYSIVKDAMNPCGFAHLQDAVILLSNDNRCRR